MVDNGATEIIEIWEEICTDSIPEETTALDEVYIHKISVTHDVRLCGF